jgi:hypothetical protein
MINPRHAKEPNLAAQGQGSPMSKTHFLLTLMRAEIDKLEKLQRLEARLCATPPQERPTIQRNIDDTMEEIASLSRSVQECRAAKVLAQGAAQ